MKVSQVNNSQPNFKGGIIAKKGAAELLLGANVEIRKMAAEGRIRYDLPRFDYFLFTGGEHNLESRVENHLSKVLGMHVASVGNSICPNTPPLTMETLIEFETITGV